MGVSTHELFPESTTLTAATPGTYGLRPAGYRLPDATRIRDVTLQVSDLTRSREFYEHVLGLHTISATHGKVQMGAQYSRTPLLTLIENRGSARRTMHKALGLYHFAILLPTRADLGRFLIHLSNIGARAGASNHVISEALYLQDPDDLGIEVYADQPRSTWQQRAGELVMATDPIDARSLVHAAGDTSWTGMPSGTVMGHVHLHVGDLEGTKRFYVDGLGFDRMVWSYPSALFLAAGGYHHHLGTNLWAGPTARPPQRDDPQLLEWTLELPSASDVAAAAENLQSSGFAVEARTDGDVIVKDPWQTPLRLSTPR